MHTVRCKFKICGSHSDAKIKINKVILEHVILIPFAPFNGIYLESEIWCAKLHCVTYDVIKKEFTAYCGEEAEIFYATSEYKTKPHRSMKKIIKDYAEMGWFEQKGIKDDRC